MKVQEGLKKMVMLWSKLCGRAIRGRHFFGFLAACKLLGALAFLGVFGTFLDHVALYCWAIYFAGAVYTLHAVQKNVAPAAVFLAALVVRWFC
mmetsp:Transcript_87581/g.187902  ORF Transcript_87581/g.187902 Transcript_87581/m.187902 type:complete len:93 (+) Transcript_87581:2-280(+)